MLDLHADPVPGDSWRVKQLGGMMRRLADDADVAARDVRGLLGDHAAMTWIGAAGDAFRENIGKFPGQLDKVANSHHQCADALVAYATDLDTAQAQADRALTQARPLFEQVQSLRSQLATANSSNASTNKSYSDLTGGGNAPDATALAAAVKAKTDSQHTVDTLNSQLSGPEAQLAALRNLAHQAQGLRETAESTAERKINAATDAGIPPDSFWHKLGDLAATLWHGLVVIAKIVSFIGAIVLLVVGGPLWLIVAVVVAGLIILADTLYKYSQGEASLWDVGLAVLSCIPITKGLTTLADLKVAFEAGGLLGAGLHIGGAAFGAAKDLVSGLTSLLKGGGGDLMMLLRNGGKLPGLKPDLMMNMENVAKTAEKYGIDLGDLVIKLDRTTRGLGTGQTFNARGFTLYAEAFRKGQELVRDGNGATIHLDGESRLARTLYHELFHVNELKSGIPFPKTAAEFPPFEDRAWAAETDWWNEIGSAIRGGGTS